MLTRFDLQKVLDKYTDDSEFAGASGQIAHFAQEVADIPMDDIKEIIDDISQQIVGQAIQQEAQDAGMNNDEIIESMSVHTMSIIQGATINCSLHGFLLGIYLVKEQMQ